MNAYRQAGSSGSSSSATSSVPRIAIVTGASSARITRNVTSWTVTTAPGIVARGKRALRTSAPCSSSDGAALQHRLAEEDPDDEPDHQKQRVVGMSSSLKMSRT